MIKLEYSTLLEPVTAEDIKAYKAYKDNLKSTKISATGKRINRVATVALVLFFAIPFIGAVLDSGSIFSIMPMLMVLGVIGLVVYLVSSHSIKRGAKLYKFAKANNIEYHLYFFREWDISLSAD